MRITGAKLAHMVGTQVRTIDRWDRANVLHPTLVAANGSGSRRGYGRSDVLAAAIMVAMFRDYGVTEYAVMREVANVVKADTQVFNKRWLVLADSGKVVTAQSDADLAACLRANPGLSWVVDIKRTLCTVHY